MIKSHQTFWLKNLFLALCFAPFMVKIPYFFRALELSPLERHNIVIWLMIPAIAAICEFSRRRAGIPATEGVRRHRNLAIFFLALCLILYALIGFQINALGIILAIAIIMLGLDLRFGRNVFLAQLPAAAFALLASPSVSYWIGYYFNVGLNTSKEYFVFKLAFGFAFFVAWNLRAIWIGRYPRMINFIYAFLFVCALSFWGVMNHTQPCGDAFTFDDSASEGGAWTKSDEPETNEDKRFFSRTTKIKRASYYSDEQPLRVLFLNISNPADIHPVGLCIKSAGGKVLSSEQIFLPVDKGQVQANEICARIGGQKYAVYSMLFDERISTGDFAKFRFYSRESKNWNHLQIFTLLGDKTMGEHRAEISEFLSAFGSAENKAAAK